MAENARMNRITSGWVFVLALIFLTAVYGSAGGQEVSAPEGWIELPAGGASTASAFLVVKNPTMYDVYLVSAAAGVAKSVEFRDADEGETKTRPKSPCPPTAP